MRSVSTATAGCTWIQVRAHTSRGVSICLRRSLVINRPGAAGAPDPEGVWSKQLTRYDFTAIPVRASIRPAPAPKQSLIINWVIPDFIQGAGGHTTIFRMAAHLQGLGHQNIFWIPGGSTHPAPSSYIDTHFFPLRCPVRPLAMDNLDEVHGDLVIATQCWTAYYVRGIRDVWRKCYLVQDYEPYFYPLGTDYHYARRTYHFGFHTVVVGNWLRTMMAREGVVDTHSFELAYDSLYYHPLERPPVTAGPFRIAFYARATTERRMVILGLKTLAMLGRIRDDFIVHFFGQKLESDGFNYSCVDAGVLNETALGELYRNCDLGIVFSATNHSVIPTEMMACGLPVLELAGENNSLIYPPGSIALVEPDEQAMADCIARLLDSVEERAALRAAGLAYAATLSWEASVKKVASALLDINPSAAESRLPR